jgi:hypothetical protein
MNRTCSDTDLRLLLALVPMKDDDRYGATIERVVRHYRDEGNPWLACRLAQKSLEHSPPAILANLELRLALWDLVASCCGMLARERGGELRRKFKRLKQEAEREARILRSRSTSYSRPKPDGRQNGNMSN